MKYITYATEKRINKIKKISLSERSIQVRVAIDVWDRIFSRNGYYGATLKELEQYLGFRLDNSIQIEVYYCEGIHGIEYKTNRNARYVGTHDLSYINIDDYNLFVKNIAE